jgi:hypothetical protein
MIDNESISSAVAVLIQAPGTDLADTRCTWRTNLPDYTASHQAKPKLFTKTKLRDLRLRAKYTNRATAVCPRS